MRFMRKLVSGLVGESISKDQSLSDFGRIQGYQVMLQTKLAMQAENARACLDSLDLAKLPEGTERLHLEIFKPDFEVRLFAMDLDFQPVDDPDYSADELERVNAELDSLPPLMSEEDRGRFLIWEEAADGARKPVAEQPIDKADLDKVFAPFVGYATETLEARFSGVVTAGFHEQNPDLLHHPAARHR